MFLKKAICQRWFDQRKQRRCHKAVIAAIQQTVCEPSRPLKKDREGKNKEVKKRGTQRLDSVFAHC